MLSAKRITVFDPVGLLALLAQAGIAQATVAHPPKALRLEAPTRCSHQPSLVADFGRGILR
jgi:hypothetical protein